jgi:hypothetical protein
VHGATLPTVSPGGGLAATGWLDGRGVPQVRLYYLDVNQVIQEHAWDGERWHSGATLPAGVTGSALAAVSWAVPGDQHQIRVYFVDQNNGIQEYGWFGDRWGAGTKLPATIHGNGLAATAFPGNPGHIHIRVYFLAKNNNVQEYGWNDGWKAGALLGTAAQRSGLAAIGWLDGTEARIRVYYEDVDHTLREKAFRNGAWFPGEAYVPAVTTAVTTEVDEEASARPGRRQVGESGGVRRTEA